MDTYKLMPSEVHDYHRHGRDNKIHIYDLSSIVLAASNLSFTRNLPSIANPTALEPLYSLGTNALGYCKCSILQMNSSEALLAVPSTLEDHLVDIFHLPSTNRVHRSIGKEMFDTKTGTVMCLSLFRKSEHLHCLVAYEDGRLALFVHSGNTGSEAIIPEENQGWTKLLEMHEHKEPSKWFALVKPTVVAKLKHLFKTKSWHCAWTRNIKPHGVFQRIIWLSVTIHFNR